MSCKRLKLQMLFLLLLKSAAFEHILFSLPGTFTIHPIIQFLHIITELD